MKKMFVGAGIAALAVSAPAAAQDSETAGGKFVVGGIVGIDRVEFEVDDVTSREEDAVFGVTAGYDYETAKGLLFGIEAEYTDSSLGVSLEDEDTGERLSVNAGRDLYIGGRLGFRPGKNGLLYVKAGYTNASIEVEYDDGLAEVSAEQSFDGFRLGAGGEIDLGRNYGIRLEYRYSDYGTLEAFDIDTGLGVSRHQGVVTLLGKF